MYTAREIAHYIVSFCLKENEPVSNLRLQKLLYFAQYRSLKDFRKPLFDDDISAWQYGPVVPEVYFEFCIYGGMPIIADYNTNLDENTKTFLNCVVKDLKKYSSWDLVKCTHQNGTAWDKVYLSGNGNGITIPLDLIIDDVNNEIGYPA